MSIDLNKKQLKYLTFGSPLMDMIVDVDSDFINKHSITLDTTLHVGNEGLVVYREARQHNPIYIAGGCSYNAIRVLNWMNEDLEERGTVACLGSVGEDEDGERFRDLLANEKIVSLFETFKGKETGKCAVICLQRERTHLTSLGASTLISDEFVEANWESIKTVSLVYTELYILSSRASIVYKLAELCLDEEKVFGFNFPSTFFLNKFREEILDVISYGDVIFANKEEAKYFVREVLQQEYENDSELPIILSKIPKKNRNKRRVVVVTCGPEPAHIAAFNHETYKLEFTGTYEPMYVEKEDIVDTNGAGDSFAGGFLAYYMKGAKLDDCVKAGHWAAQRIIKLRGCDIPFDEKPYNPLNKV